MFIGCTVLRESENDGYYVVQPSIAQGEAVEAIDIHRRGDLVPGDNAILIQAGNQYGVAGLFHNLSSVIGVPDSARASIEAIAPANVACSYLAHLINRARVYYRRARVIEVIPPWLNIRFFDGPFPNRTISVPIAPSQGLMASFFKPDDFVIVNTWQYQEPSVTGWWEAPDFLVWFINKVSANNYALLRIKINDAVEDAEYSYRLGFPRTDELRLGTITRRDEDGAIIIFNINSTLGLSDLFIDVARFFTVNGEVETAPDFHTHYVSGCPRDDIVVAAQGAFLSLFNYVTKTDVAFVSRNGLVFRGSFTEGASGYSSRNTIYITSNGSFSDGEYPCVCTDNKLYVATGVYDGGVSTVLEEINLPYNARACGVLPLKLPGYDLGTNIIIDDDNLYHVKIRVEGGSFVVTTLDSEPLATPLPVKGSPGGLAQITMSFDDQGRIMTNINNIDSNINISSASHEALFSSTGGIGDARKIFGCPVWSTD